MTLEEFRKDFIDQLRVDASLEQTDTEDAFVKRSIELLEDCGEISDIIQSYYGKRRANKSMMEFHAYGFDEADGSLMLLISDFKDTYEPENLGTVQLDALYKRMINFLDTVYKKKILEYCDESDEVFSIAKEILSVTGDDLITSSLLKYKFYIITNSKLSGTVKRIKQNDYNSRPVELNVWTIERFYEYIQSESNEEISIDIKDYNVSGLPTLKEEVDEELEYDAYLSIVPGRFLAEIYLKYGSRLLEGNVRSFLSVKGKVNSGIRKTILSEPTKFFTYNNGIAATASEVEFDETGSRIERIKNLQIINGGQTTASLASAVVKKENVDLSGIYVAMKLTVLKPDVNGDDGEDVYNSLVERISRCANSQNTVKDADFFSNSPFHVIMEKLSQKCIAPPANGSPFSTLWYYERSRGKYDQEQFKMNNKERDNFRKKYPKSQKITKEELAKYMTTINGHPERVVYGSAKIMNAFGAEIEKEYQEHKENFNEFYYKKVVAAAIMYKTTDSIVNRQPWYIKGGNKAQIVPYTIAKILDLVPSGFSINYALIWKKQELYPSFVRQIEIVSQVADQFLMASNGIIVRDYARDPKTWQKFREIQIKLNSDFIMDLVPESEIKSEAKSAKKEQKELNKVADEIEVYNYGSDYWKNLIKQAQKMKLLSNSEEGMLMTATRMEGDHAIIPNSRQAKKILEIRKRLGEEGVII